jgi:hypothetical protein
LCGNGIFEGNNIAKLIVLVKLLNSVNALEAYYSSLNKSYRVEVIVTLEGLNELSNRGQRKHEKEGPNII